MPVRCHHQPVANGHAALKKLGRHGDVARSIPAERVQCIAMHLTHAHRRMCVQFVKLQLLLEEV